MLQVGNVGLNFEEQRSHFALWCVAGAPLLAGTDLVHADAQTLSILTAKELIEVCRVAII
jgi:alpha-galactosidase